MIEILSNFYIKNKNIPDDNIPENSIIHVINTDNIDKKLPLIIQDYKNLQSIVIIYSYNEDIKYFLSKFTKEYCNIKIKSEFEDVLLMNRCVFF